MMPAITEQLKENFMYNVTVYVYSHKALINVVNQTVDTWKLRALRTIHGSNNVVINL